MLAISFSCSNPKEGKSGDDGFYESIAGWDIRHVPIIPPFRATSTYPEQWGIQGIKKLNDIQVLAFGVTRNYIYGKIPDVNYNDTGRWFLINTNSLLYSEYDTESELDATLAKYNLEKNTIKLCEEYFQQLSKGERCYWFPKKGKSYPKYQDTIPVSAVTINVMEDDKGLDFEILGTIKKDVSKIYYFKILFNKERNDLYYISFDNASPKLLSNKDVVAAYAEGDSLIVSVYTPFSVAEKKGIREEDRIVLAKAVPLKK